MYFTEQGNRLSARRQNETIWIEAWGKNALRVRATYNFGFTGHRGALADSAVTYTHLTLPTNPNV